MKPIGRHWSHWNPSDHIGAPLQSIWSNMTFSGKTQFCLVSPGTHESICFYISGQYFPSTNESQRSNLSNPGLDANPRTNCFVSFELKVWYRSLLYCESIISDPHLKFCSFSQRFPSDNSLTRVGWSGMGGRGRVGPPLR